ncbi:hypothetical protein Bca101_067990 [Brassica carinata]
MRSEQAFRKNHWTILLPTAYIESHDVMKSLDRDCEYPQFIKSLWTILLPTAYENFRQEL